MASHMKRRMVAILGVNKKELVSRGDGVILVLSEWGWEGWNGIHFSWNQKGMCKRVFVGEKTTVALPDPHFYVEMNSNFGSKPRLVGESG